MARTRGTFNIGSNYDVSVKKPFDARMLVPTYNDLTTKSNWYLMDSDGNLTTTFIAYNGMLVAVADKSDAANSGLYMLFDKYSGKNPNVEDSNNWLKIGETSDVSDLVDRITQIDSELSDINDRLEALEADRTHVYGYRKDFPSVGERDHIYIANDECRTYVYIGGENPKYLPIADQFEYTDHDDNSETPEVRIICGGNANY